MDLIQSHLIPPLITPGTNLLLSFCSQALSFLLGLGTELCCLLEFSLFIWGWNHLSGLGIAANDPYFCFSTSTCILAVFTAFFTLSTIYSYPFSSNHTNFCFPILLITYNSYRYTSLNYYVSCNLFFTCSCFNICFYCIVVFIFCIQFVKFIIIAPYFVPIKRIFPKGFTPSWLNLCFYKQSISNPQWH